MEKLRERIAEIEKRLTDLEAAQQLERKTVTEIRQIMDELVNMEASSVGQQKTALERIRNLLKGR